MAFVKSALLERMDLRTAAEKERHDQRQAEAQAAYEIAVENWREESAPQLVDILADILKQMRKGNPVTFSYLERRTGSRYGGCPNYWFKQEPFERVEFEEPFNRVRLREVLDLLDEETITVSKLQDLGFGREALRQAIG